MCLGYRILHRCSENYIIESVLPCTFSDLILYLSKQDKARHLVTKSFDPLVIGILLIISAAYKYCLSLHRFDSLDGSVGIGSL